MSWDSGLEGPAYYIASTDHTPLCVVAGPGTGKTFTLMRRVTRLIQEEGVDPSRILACTFTRTAAEDLALSVAALGVQGADQIRAQTLHSLCFSMLSREYIFNTTGRVPRPLLKFEERFLLQDLCAAGHGGIRDCVERLLAFSAAWARLQHERPGWPHDPQDRSFQTTLDEWLRFHKAMLIGELVPEAIKYLRNNPQSYYRTAYDHVLVDEYQDLNKAEQVLIDYLSSDSLMIIGDEDQSIYSFKHAHPEGIVEFPTTHDGTDSVELDECRRCPKSVVVLANALISNNQTRSARNLNPYNENPDGEVFVVQWPNAIDESEGITSFIKSRIDQGLVIPGNILVLSPRKEFGYMIRDKLVEQGVPAHSFFSEEPLDGDPKKLESSKAQQALSLLTLIADPDDIVALRCWCGFGSPSLNSNAWNKLRIFCETTGEKPWVVLDRLTKKEINIPHTKPLVDRFQILQSELQRLGSLRDQDLIKAVLPDDEDWAKVFSNFCASIDCADFGADKIIEAIRRNVSQPEMPTDVDYVRVMSLYKSKGLTADHVVIVGCIDGLIPTLDEDQPRAQQQHDLEEQRRLFYVAITRTRHTLVLSNSTRLPTSAVHRMRAHVGRTFGGVASMITSRFIHELGSECPRAIKGAEFLSIIYGE